MKSESFSVCPLHKLAVSSCKTCAGKWPGELLPASRHPSHAFAFVAACLTPGTSAAYMSRKASSIQTELCPVPLSNYCSLCTRSGLYLPSLLDSAVLPRATSAPSMRLAPHNMKIARPFPSTITMRITAPNRRGGTPLHQHLLSSITVHATSSDGRDSSNDATAFLQN